MKWQAKSLLMVLSVWVAPTIHATELLGHISDDTEPAALPVSEPKNDRQIIYRVICSPEGEALPDCERPFADQEGLPAPVADEQGPVDGDTANEDSIEPKRAEKSEKKAKSTKKKTNKKTKSQTKPKKSAKKTKSNKK